MIAKFLFITMLFLPQSVFCQTFEEDLVAAAFDRTTHSVKYDGSYFSIKYPGGDVPANIGVCTDVVIRTYRAIGTDLQKLVHEDMSQNFDIYPSKRIWGLSGTDRNIDHRRVPNLQTFFSRHGHELSVTIKAQNYSPGDLVTWMLPGNLPHIGIVIDKISSRTGNPIIVHNVGLGPKSEDVLFKYPITGHYKYVPEKYRRLVQSGDHVIERQPFGTLIAFFVELRRDRGIVEV